MAVGGPLVRRFFWGPRAGVGIGGGLDVLHSSGFQVWGTPTRKQNIREFASRRLGPKRHASTEVSALPRVAIGIGFLAPIIRFGAPGGILKYPTEHDGN